MGKWKLHWESSSQLTPKVFVCGHCSEKISSNTGYIGKIETRMSAFIYLCHTCGNPTYFDPGGNQYPGAAFGKEFNSIEEYAVNDLYNEARRCYSNNCFTACVLCCRKLLMNISVERGAKEGERFFNYVNFLADNNWIPPNGKGWVDYVRQSGNEAAHEIELKDRDEAEMLITFVEMLLIFIYDFPSRFPEMHLES